MHIHILYTHEHTYISCDADSHFIASTINCSTCVVTCDCCLTAAGRQPAELERALRGHRPSVPGGEPMTSFAVVMPCE